MMTIIIAFNVSYIISFPLALSRFLALSSLGWFFQNASFDALVSHSVDAHEINECASNFLCAWNDDETAALTPYTTCMCTPIYYYCLPASLALKTRCVHLFSPSLLNARHSVDVYFDHTVPSGQWLIVDTA